MKEPERQGVKTVPRAVAFQRCRGIYARRDIGMAMPPIRWTACGQWPTQAHGSRQQRQ